MRGHLIRRGGTYHFRRRVPDALRPVLGMREISRSLGTASPREAAGRANAAWSQSEGLFKAMRDDPEAAALVRALAAEPAGASVAAISIENDIRQPPKDLSESLLGRVHDAVHAMLPMLKLPEIRNIEAHLAVLARIHESAVQGQEAALAVDRERLARLRDALVDAEQATAELASAERLGAATTRLDASVIVAGQRTATMASDLAAERRLVDRLASRSPAPPDPEPAPPSPAPRSVAISVRGKKKPMWSSQVAGFIAEKSRRVDGHEGYDLQVQRQSETTLRMWVEVVGDRPLDDYTGADAGAFRDLLLRLPSTHGKSSVRVLPVDAARAADAKQQGINARNAALAHDAPREPDVQRLSMKTVKRHFSTLSQFWMHAKRHSHVSGENPFKGWEYQGVKKGAAKRVDWSTADLMTLLSSPWVAGDIRWIVAVAMHSGMRVEEIFRLRPGADIVERDGILCLLVQPQVSPSRWTPKSDAGTRTVPVHSVLLELGFADLVAARQGWPRLFPGGAARGSSDDLSARFVKEFSRQKSGLGIGSQTTFHSFRHSVSTMLRNAPGMSEPWIDALLGHTATPGASQGVTS